MECEVCGRQMDSSNETGLCDICLKLVEFEEKREEVREERIERNCLRCDQVFWAQGRFNRICSSCTERNRKVADAERYELWLIRNGGKYEQKWDPFSPIC